MTERVPARGQSRKGEERRAAIIDSAVRRFAQRGLYGTSTQDIARDVGISQPYIYRLFENKTQLFVAAVDHVSDVLAASMTGAARGATANGADLVAEVTGSYGRLVGDEVLLRFLLQANCALDEEEIAAALRRCYAKQVRTLEAAAPGVSGEQVRAIFGANLLANVIVGLGLHTSDDGWARSLSGR